MHQTENNWLTTNINDRLTNKESDFKVFVNPYSFVSKSFDEECDITAKKFASLYENIFIGFSGGMDSEFVCSIFLRNNIKFTPIIVLFNGNKEESEYAFAFCRENKVKPIIIKLTDNELLKIIYYDIIKKYNGIGINSVGAIHASKYALSQNGIFLTAEHAIGDGTEKVKDFQYYFSEWDFYFENITFFAYRLELFYSMVEAIDDKYQDWQTCKYMLYKCKFRKKMYPKYNSYVANIIQKIIKYNQNIKYKHNLGTKEEVLKLLKC